jgi:hypothetical protein
VCSARCRAKRWRRAQQAAARQADQRAEVEQLRAEVERLRAQVAAHEERDRMSDAMFAGIAWYAGLARAKLAAA